VSCSNGTTAPELPIPDPILLYTRTYNTERESIYRLCQQTVPPLTRPCIVISCGATQANVTRDVQILSQLTTRIRLYGANCNQTAMVLQAIQDTKVDLSVYVAICEWFGRAVPQRLTVEG
jgi:hypothetical protein